MSEACRKSLHINSSTKLQFRALQPGLAVTVKHFKYRKRTHWILVHKKEEHILIFKNVIKYRSTNWCLFWCSSVLYTVTGKMLMLFVFGLSCNDRRNYDVNLNVYAWPHRTRPQLTHIEFRFLALWKGCIEPREFDRGDEVCTVCSLHTVQQTRMQKVLHTHRALCLHSSSLHPCLLHCVCEQDMNLSCVVFFDLEASTGLISYSCSVLRVYVFLVLSSTFSVCHCYRAALMQCMFLRAPIPHLQPVTLWP